MAFVLNILERNLVHASFLVSGFATLPENRFKDSMNTFVKDFDLEQIRQQCSKFIVFHSDNDPYVPIEKAEELKERLGAELIIIKNAAHFNEEAGYKEFEELLEKIKN